MPDTGETLLAEFPRQLLWQPSAPRLPRARSVLVCGMGGSHLAADLLAAWLTAREDDREIRVHSSYGVPQWAERCDRVVLSSYSGETEETLHAWQVARDKGLPVATIAAGGALLAAAREAGAPYVELPHPPRMQPRFALGWSARALAELCGWEDVARELEATGERLSRWDPRRVAQEIARAGREKVVVVYGAHPYGSVARLWKIFFNETGKTFAWDAALPEANHNDIEAFDAPSELWTIGAQRLLVVFLLPEKAHPRVEARLRVTRDLLAQKEVATLTLGPEEFGEVGLWGAVWAGMWAGYLLAKERGVDPFAVPLIAALKATLKKN